MPVASSSDDAKVEKVDGSKEYAHKDGTLTVGTYCRVRSVSYKDDNGDYGA